MDLKLQINELNLEPGSKVDIQALKNHKFRSAGLVSRLVKRLPRGQSIFHSKNCTIDCFDNRWSLYPCTHEYLTLDRQWKTQASILLVNDRVKKVNFHVVDGVYAAQNFLEKFKSICSEHFGDPKQAQTNLYQWTNESVSFSGFLHADNVTADFTIEYLDQ